MPQGINPLRVWLDTKWSGFFAARLARRRMSSFTVRVELRDHPAGDDYDTLHKAMEAEGFSRTIDNGNGVIYRLPTAEYNFIGDLSNSEVIDKAKRAADQTGKAYCVLVTESKGRRWVNLELVQPVQSAESS